MTKKMTQLGIIEVVQMAGSVASVTGVSLLWISSLLGNQGLLFKIPIVALITLFSLGLMTGGYLVLRAGYRFFVNDQDSIGRFTFIAITSPIVFGAIFFGLFTIWYMTIQEFAAINL